MKLTVPLALLALTLSSAARADEQDTTRPYFPNISPTIGVQDCRNCLYSLIVDWQQRASDFYGPPVDHFDMYRGRYGKSF
ncbi:MAG: hypothetical protein JST92_18190, partial [Deltaproteobacteria bacterium]|nr:hypothetical protein [Deltaproteobacteria bacterium]